MTLIPSAPQTHRPLRGLFSPLAKSAAGMSTQQTFMDVIAENIRNAETTRTSDGGPYHRQVGVSDGSKTQILSDGSAGSLVYNPGHPDADSNGMVRMPNVDVDAERADLMIAQRMHEANATVFSVAKNMLRRAIDI